MKDVFSIDRPGGDGQAQDSGGPGLVLHVCDMTEMKYAFLISPATTFFAALVVIEIGVEPRIRGWITQLALASKQAKSVVLVPRRGACVRVGIVVVDRHLLGLGNAAEAIVAVGNSAVVGVATKLHHIPLKLR